MVKVPCHGSELYIDDRLKQQLDRVKKRVTQKDEDYFFAVDGNEGAGKSVLALQLAAYLDPSFCLDRVVFTPEGFQQAIIDARKGQVVVFDEAFRGLSSRGALSQVNKLLIQLMMECRQKNLIVFVVTPTFFLLEKYVALWRCKGLFHVYKRAGQKGFWAFFNSKTKRQLYFHGKKNYYSYAFPKANFLGRFTNQYLVDEDEYRALKKKYLEASSTHGPSEDFKVQRNFLLWYLNRKLEFSTREISVLCRDHRWVFAQQSVSDAVRAYEKSVGDR